MRRFLWLVVLVALSCQGQTGWTRFGDMESFQETFNADADHVRVVLLLSPT